MEHTIFEVEAIELLLVLYMLRSEQDARRVTIKLDNQAVLAALSICKPKPTQYLIDEILQQIEHIWGHLRDPGFRLEIGWVRGHSGVEGNERVDKEAKLVVKGQSSWACSLPRFLVDNTFPLSVSVWKQEFEAHLLDQ